MQSPSLFLILIMIIVVPIIIIFADHNIFFVAVAIGLLISSFKGINTILFNITGSSSDRDTEMVEELEEVEDMVNINFKKFGVGINVAKNLIVFLFFIYSAFFVNSFWVKAVIAGLAIYRIHGVFNNIISNRDTYPYEGTQVTNIIALLVNISTVLIIILISCNKFIKNII